MKDQKPEKERIDDTECTLLDLSETLTAILNKLNRLDDLERKMRVIEENFHLPWGKDGPIK